MSRRLNIIFAVILLLFLTLPTAQASSGQTNKMTEMEDEFQGAQASSSSSVHAKDASLLDASIHQQQMHASHVSGRRVTNEQVMSQQGKFDLVMKYCSS